VKINKTPFHQDESQAFVLNRILLDLQAGAFRLIQDGGWFHYEIDELVRTCFFPTGVFEFFDHVGIDIMLASIRNYTENAKNPEFYTPMINLLEAMGDYNHLGIKTGQGFYTYSGKKGTHSAVVTIAEKGEAEWNSAKDLLWGYYLNSVASITKSGLCTSDELAGYLKDYFGTDNDPFTMTCS